MYHTANVNGRHIHPLLPNKHMVARNILWFFLILPNSYKMYMPITYHHKTPFKKNNWALLSSSSKNEKFNFTYHWIPSFRAKNKNTQRKSYRSTWQEQFKIILYRTQISLSSEEVLLCYPLPYLCHDKAWCEFTHRLWLSCKGNIHHWHIFLCMRYSRLEWDIPRAQLCPHYIQIFKSLGQSACTPHLTTFTACKFVYKHRLASI